MRARLALAASGQACELREVVLRNKPQGLLQASPKATVPVLVLPDGQVLDQSLDIMLWALEQNDPGDWLQPSQGGKADMLACIETCDGPFKQALDRCKYPDRYPAADTGAERTKAAAWLETLESRLRSQPHLFGAHATWRTWQSPISYGSLPRLTPTGGRRSHGQRCRVGWRGGRPAASLRR